MTGKTAKEERSQELAEVWALIEELERVSHKLKNTADKAIKRAQEREEEGNDG